MKFLFKNNESFGKNQTIFYDKQRKLRKVIEVLHFNLRIDSDPVKKA